MDRKITKKKGSRKIEDLHTDKPIPRLPSSTNRNLAKQDMLLKNIVVTLIVFLLLETHLPEYFEIHRHIYLLVQTAVLLMMTMELEEKEVQEPLNVKVHTLMIFIALFIQHHTNSQKSTQSISENSAILDKDHSIT